MKKQIKTWKGQKNFSDSDICRNEESSNATSQEKKMVKLTGKLTSRIETKNKENQPYYYGFFKLESQAGEFPVVFKKEKPTISKGNQVLLEGNWVQSNGSRPSFTATQYQIDPPHQVQINCFYSSKFEPCAFTTHESQLMENTIGKSTIPNPRRYSMVNIYQKLQSIQAKTGAISKTERNKFQNYKYFTEYQALNILKPLLEDQKLTLTFSDDPHPNQHRKNRKRLSNQILKTSYSH